MTIDEAMSINGDDWCVCLPSRGGQRGAVYVADSASEAGRMAYGMEGAIILRAGRRVDGEARRAFAEFALRRRAELEAEYADTDALRVGYLPPDWWLVSTPEQDFRDYGQISKQVL